MTADNPGVVVRPPRLYLGALGPGLALDYFKPVPWLPMPVQYPVGLALIAAGVALVFFVVGRFKAAGRNVPTPLVLGAQHALQFHGDAHITFDLELAGHEGRGAVQLALGHGDEVIQADL